MRSEPTCLRIQVDAFSRHVDEMTRQRRSSQISCAPPSVNEPHLMLWSDGGTYAGMPNSGKPVTVVAPSGPIDTSTIGSPKSLC